MHRVLAVFIALLLSACAGVQRIPSDYSGPGAGKAVIGMGAITGTSYSSYSLLFRRVDQRSLPADQQQVGRIIFFQKNIFYAKKPDYGNQSEEGVVLVQSLPAAEYEIFNFDIFFNAGTVQKNFSSREPFSIPFTVEVGKTTYLGNYQANGIIGKNIFGISLPAGAVFAITNRAHDDLRMAHGKDALISTDAKDETPTAKSIGSPFFVEPR